MESWLTEINFERPSPLRKAMSVLISNPIANYTPPGLLRALLKFGKSELAAANWKDPGGWRSMVISYDGKCHKTADKILVGASTISRALRNRRKLAGAILARLIDESPRQPAHVLCLGAGPGRIIADALCATRLQATATLVDLSNDAFEYGQRLMQGLGLADRVKYVVGDAREIGKILDKPVDIVKMLGLCEYLSDEQIVSIVQAVAAVMPPGAPLVVNSLSDRHGTDRFFRNVLGLHMIYRDVPRLQEILSQAGFGEFVAFPEPLGVYQVMVARRR